MASNAANSAEIGWAHPDSIGDIRSRLLCLYIVEGPRACGLGAQGRYAHSVRSRDSVGQGRAL